VVPPPNMRIPIKTLSGQSHVAVVSDDGTVEDLARAVVGRSGVDCRLFFGVRRVTFAWGGGGVVFGCGREGVC